jgi:hypothetical protein
MGIVNKRNALIGWATWSAVKRVAAMKAKRAVPAESSGSKGKKAVKVVAVVAAVGGALAFWKATHRDSTDHDSIAAEDPGTPSE